MIGLVIADFFTLIPTAVLAGILINGEITLTSFLCDLMGVVLTMTFEVTAFVQSAMSIEKCISIVSPIKHRNFAKSRHVKKITGTIVAICFLFPLIFNVAMKSVGVVDFGFQPDIPQCALTNDNGAPSYQLTVVLFVLSPMVMQMITHAIIFTKIKRMRTMHKNKVIKAMKTLSLTVGIYYICWMPTLIIQIWVVVMGKDPPGLFIFAGIQILMANSGMSGIIYYTNLPNFRQAFTYALGRHRGQVSPSAPSQRPTTSKGLLENLNNKPPQASTIT